MTYATVDLTRADHDGYYSGLSNAAVWPLFHYRLYLMKLYPPGLGRMPDNRAPTVPLKVGWLQPDDISPPRYSLRRTPRTWRPAPNTK